VQIVKQEDDVSLRTYFERSCFSPVECLVRVSGRQRILRSPASASVTRSLLHGEVRNRLTLAAIEYLKIVFLQVLDHVAVGAPHNDWYQHHVDIAFELHRVSLLRGLRTLRGGKEGMRAKRHKAQGAGPNGPRKKPAVAHVLSIAAPDARAGGAFCTVDPLFAILGGAESSNRGIVMAEPALIYEHEGNQSLNFSVQLKDIQKKLPLRVLSEDDWRHWTTWGYVIVPDAAPAQNIERLKALLWEFQELDPADPSSWNQAQLRDHKMLELNNSGMVEIYNHQCLWDNRQQARIYNTFVDIWDREDLWVTIDRANLNTPNRGARPFGGFIHWDSDTSMRPLPVNVQGVLSLVDTDPEVGGFQCVPELFRNFDQWIETQPADRHPFFPDTTGFEIKFVPLKAGDLLVWNTLLAHGIRPNVTTDRARLAQYLSMYPADEANAAVRETRIRSWREREIPDDPAFPGDPRDWERTRYGRAELTELGERLLGLRSWKS